MFKSQSYNTTTSKPATKFILLDYNFFLVNLVNVIILNSAMYPKITIIHKKACQPKH